MNQGSLIKILANKYGGTTFIFFGIKECLKLISHYSHDTSSISHIIYLFVILLCNVLLKLWNLKLNFRFFRECKKKMENMLSGLERMVEYDLIVVLRHLTKKDKMSLRASSTTLRRRIDELENTFKVWRIGEVDSTRLRRLSDEIHTIQGNTCNREYILQTYNLNTLETEF